MRCKRLKYEKENEKVIKKSFKDSSMQYCFHSADYSKWLKNPESKEDVTKCLDDSLFTH